MKTIKHLLPELALAVELATSPLGFAGAFTNGSFEVLSGVQLKPGQIINLPVGDTGLVGWTIGGTGGAVSVMNGIVPGSSEFLPIDGANQLNFNGGDSAPGTFVSQTFDTVVGADYIVSFYVGHQGVTTARLSLTATVFPTSGPSLAQVVATPPAHGYGDKQSFSFTATSPTATLQFADTSLDTVNADLDLDEVTVTVIGQPNLLPTTDDLWDISRGVVITGQSPMLTCGGASGPFDPRDIFGGHFSPTCATESSGSAIFIDGKPDGFVHFVEWATPNPVTIRSFNLWALGSEDSPTNPTWREMAGFRLLAKSTDISGYDLVLYSFTPSHPYKFVDDVYGLLISSDIKPTTSRQFRAEFINFAVASGQSGPRILELDGFGEFIGPTVGIRASEAEVSWDSVASLKYQIEYLEDLPGSNWTALGSPVVGDGSTMRVTDKIAPGQVRRFYRVRATE